MHNSNSQPALCWMETSKKEKRNKSPIIIAAEKWWSTTLTPKRPCSHSFVRNNWGAATLSRAVYVCVKYAFPVQPQRHVPLLKWFIFIGKQQILHCKEVQRRTGALTMAESNDSVSRIDLGHAHSRKQHWAPRLCICEQHGCCIVWWKFQIRA